MRKSGASGTISKLFGRKSSSNSLYSSTPSAGGVVNGPGDISELGKLDHILTANTSDEEAMNRYLDSGTARVKSRPTVKLTIPHNERPEFSVPDRLMISTIPRVAMNSGYSVKDSKPSPVGNYGPRGFVPDYPDDDWIPPPPSMAPPPPPPMAAPPPPPYGGLQGPRSPSTFYEMPTPPPPMVAPPPPPPTPNSRAQPVLSHPSYPLPDPNSLLPPRMIPPAPPLVKVPHKAFEVMEEQYPRMPLQPPPNIPVPGLSHNHFPLKTSIQDEVSRLRPISRPKNAPPPPPQRQGLHRPFSLPLKDEVLHPLPSSASFPNAMAPQASLSSHRSPFAPEPPHLFPNSSVASTFNPKATAKLYGFSPNANGSEMSRADRQSKTKSMLIMQDASEYALDSRDKEAEGPAESRPEISSTLPKPQKPARKSNALFQQSKSEESKGSSAYDSNALSKGRPFPHKEGRSAVDPELSLQRVSADRTSESSSSRYSFPSPGMGYGRNRAEEESKPTATMDSEGGEAPGFPYTNRQPDDEVVNRDKRFDAAISAPKSPYSSAEQTPSDTRETALTRSPLDLLMAAKQRDAKRKSPVERENKGFPNHVNSEAPGGFQGCKSAITNTFRVTPYHSGPESTEPDVETALFLIPPPPSFSDEGSEDFSFRPLPPPLEFSNREDDDGGVPASQPQAKANGRMAIGRPLPPADYHSASNVYNGPTDGRSYSPYRPTLNVGSLTALAVSSDKTKPSLASKPTFAPGRGSSLLPNSSPPHSLPTAKAYTQTTPKMDHRGTLLSADKLGGESRVVTELQSNLDTDSTQDSKGSQRPQHLSYGRTFTVRPGAKQPISWN